MVPFEPGRHRPLILHIWQGEYPLCPFMHISMEIAGMSPNTRIRNAHKAKCAFSRISNAGTPLARQRISCTNGHRKESASFGFLGMTPRDIIETRWNRISGGRL